MVKEILMNLTKETKRRIYQILSEIKDPEIPVINIVELGIIKEVELNNGILEVSITPTYSGCPAMHAIKSEIVSRLQSENYHSVVVKVNYSPAWTTDFMTQEAKEKLKNYGIAPPKELNRETCIPISLETVECPFCGSSHTELKSRFGSTACKSFYYCKDCLQLFEHFKSF
jgi:ring-1,2-phenylacetyl-CoA epoxidase subunit PaaD